LEVLAKACELRGGPLRGGLRGVGVLCQALAHGLLDVPRELLLQPRCAGRGSLCEALALLAARLQSPEAGRPLLGLALQL